MYVPISSDFIIDFRNVVGIFDIDKLTVYKSNRTYLSKMEKEGKILSTTEKIPKSFIVCNENGEERVYISQFLPATLIKR